MTTRAKNQPVHVAKCPKGHDLYIYQAKGRLAYLYARCLVCNTLDQRPHVWAAQDAIWKQLPAAVQGSIRRPWVLREQATTDVCPCCCRPMVAA